jgi:hypothetical protein
MSNVKLCGPEEYRQELFNKFNTAAIFALLISAMENMEDPVLFRETLIKTWADKMTEEYMDDKQSIVDQLSMLPEDCELPLHLTPDGLEDQERTFFAIMEEITSDIRSMLNKPKDGGV